MWLENTFMTNCIKQVLHIATLHGWLPGASHEANVKFVPTRKSLKFFRCQKLISSVSGNAFCSHSEAWRIGRCHLVVNPKDGKIHVVWYVTNISVQTVCLYNNGDYVPSHFAIFWINHQVTSTSPSCFGMTTETILHYHCLSTSEIWRTWVISWLGQT